MKAFKVHNIEKVKQEVNLPAGTYTYSFRVIPVGTSYTFRLDNQLFTFEGLTAGVLNKRMKHTFELTETVSFFYLSNTVGDCVCEPQIEEGVFATTPGSHPLDFERLISETGIEIDSEALSLYAKKVDVSAEIKIQTDRIDSTVGNISNDIDGIKGDVTTISQTTTSIQSTVTNHTNQISRFQQTVDLIYTSIENVGSGEFASIIQRLDGIELKVGAPGQSGSIQAALDSIALIVYDENEGMSAINQKVDEISLTVEDNEDKVADLRIDVNSISSTVYDEDEGISAIVQKVNSITLAVEDNDDKISSIEVEVNNISLTVSDENTGMSAINQKVGSITSTVTAHTNQISTFQQTVDQIYSAIENVGSGEFASIIQRLDKIELKVGAPGKEGSIQLEVDSITTIVEDIDVGLTEVVQTVGSITSTVSNHTGQISTIDQKVDSITTTVANNAGQISTIDQKVNSITLTVEDNEDKISSIELEVDSITATVSDNAGKIASIETTVGNIELSVSNIETGMSTIIQTVSSITSTVYNEHGTLLSQISQDGSTIKITASQIELEGAVTANDNFKILTDGSIEANNGKFTGTVVAKQGSSGMKTELDASGIKVFNTSGKMNIRFGMRNDYAVLEYYDNDGRFLYDLGPNGIMKMEVREEKWTPFKRISLGTDMSTILGSANRFKYKQSWGETETTYYIYTSRISAGINQDPTNDGVIFTSQNKTSSKMPLGFYCRKMPLNGNIIYKESSRTNQVINIQLPYIQSGNENVYDRNNICFMDLEYYVNGKRSTSLYYAYWNETP